jgi:4-phytase / acid phosphatase
MENGVARLRIYRYAASHQGGHMRAALQSVFFCLACAILYSAPQICVAAGEQETQPRLIKIVALSRHGVRSPTQNASTLSLWSTRPWPQWPVPQGNLTPRGARLVTAMWEDLRGSLLNLGLLPDAICPPPGKIFVRADTEQRTRATAKALLDGLCPGGTLPYAVSPQATDPLFHPVQNGVQSLDPATVAASIINSAGGDLDRLHEDNAAALTHLQHISAPMAPEFCARYNLPPTCGLADLPNSVSVAPDGTSAHLTGALATGSNLAEIFLLEYAQWPGISAGWGQVDARTLREMLPLHNSVFNTVSRSQVVAQTKGASLLSEMTDALTGKHYDQRCNTASLVVFVGHGTNIANVGALLGIHWQIHGYPDDSVPPGSTLLFELWDKGNQKEVRIRFLAQPLEALHAPFDETLQAAATAQTSNTAVVKLTDPARTHKAVQAQVTAPPVVGEARFNLENFTTIVRQRLKDAPVVPQEVPPLRLRVDEDAQETLPGRNAAGATALQGSASAP